MLSAISWRSSLKLNWNQQRSNNHHHWKMVSNLDDRWPYGALIRGTWRILQSVDETTREFGSFGRTCCFTVERKYRRSASYATGTLRKGCPVTRRLHLYELWRKEPLYNPRWPPPRRGLLLANTRQEAPPWLTARDGMIYWDFCLFAPALQRTYRVPSF